MELTIFIDVKIELYIIFKVTLLILISYVMYYFKSGRDILITVLFSQLYPLP